MSTDGHIQEKLERLKSAREGLGLQHRGILSPTTPEERYPVYEDMRSLLNPGFLSTTLDLDGVAFSIRTLASGDRFLLGHRIRPDATVWDWKLWIVASSVWMLDGVFCLGDPSVAPRVKKHLQGLRPHVLNYFFHNCMSLRRRTEEMSQGLEAYCYEPSSRRDWLSLRDALPCSEQVTGLSGTSSLGLNAFQKSWVSWNRMEDERVRDMSTWRNVKATLSVHVKKEAINRLNAQDQASFLREEETRQKEMDKFFYTTTGVIRPEDKLEGHNGVRARWATSPDDLSEEMRRWVAGEKDAHDRAVDAFKEKARTQFEAHKQALEDKKVRLLQTRGTAPVVGIPLELTGYSPQEIHKVLGYENHSGVSQVYNKGDETRQVRYLQKEVLHPGFQMEEDGRIIPTPKAPAKDINDKIQERRPVAEMERGDR